MTRINADGPWLGLDVGGANIKVAHELGACQTIPFALWRDPGGLSNVLRETLRLTPAFSRIALAMTAELCDCYDTKAQGVREVIAAVLDAAPGYPLNVWCTDGQFRTITEISLRPGLAAAANWLALAEVAARLVPKGAGILIDIGSTTTDLIPLVEGHARPVGRNDTERLASSELVYAGVRRTPLCALAHALPFRGVMTGLASELFATTQDIYLTLGAIPPDPSDLATADGRPATVAAARARLARMIGADCDGFTPLDATEFSEAVDSALLARLTAAVTRVMAPTATALTTAILAGSGEFLGLRLARRLLPGSSSIVRLDDLWGPAASSAACARALVILARARLETGGPLGQTGADVA